MENVWFSDWTALLRILMIAPAAYVLLLLFLRVSGKRTLSKMNAFDFVVTVAFGSTLATVLLNRNVSLAEGALAFALLVALQFVVTWLSVRSPAVQRIVKAEPTLLLLNGRYLEGALRLQRVTREEVQAAIRENGHAAIEDVTAVVLETDGTLSVIDQGRRRSALAGVQRWSGSEQPQRRDVDRKQASGPGGKPGSDDEPPPTRH